MFPDVPRCSQDPPDVPREFPGRSQMFPGSPGCSQDLPDVPRKISGDLMRII